MNDEIQNPPLAETEQPAEELSRERGRRKVRDLQLENVDTDKIDEIILSGRVQRGGKIRIERRGPLDQEYYYLCTIPATDWGNTEDVFERMKKMFGGGDYTCQAFRADGKIHGKFEFKIDHRFKGQLDENQIRDKSGLTEKNIDDLVNKLVPRGPKGADSADLMALVEKNSSKSESFMVLMMTMMQKSAEIQAQQTAAMFNTMAAMFGGKQSQNSENVLIELVRQSSQRTPATETLAMMKQIKDIFDDDGPEEKEQESDMMKIFKIAGPLLGGLMQSARPAATVSAPQPAAAALPTAQAIDFAAMLPALMQKLIGAAERNSDPALYADLILDQLTDDQAKILRGLLTPADWCAKIGIDERSVAHVRPWLEELRKLILENGTAADIPGGDAGGPNSGGANAAQSAPVGPDANSGVDGSHRPAE